MDKHRVLKDDLWIAFNFISSLIYLCLAATGALWWLGFLGGSCG
ncbi:hypothetical protein SAMN04488056_12317 [Cohaesibacter marisflavi]|uniref:Uncharacterized protein n=1 Tax=Cohaesibacter marisflavi TaxID=655353 RepID=A0A1I5MSS4_9HYPH|nr:hypothetical protein SAMN04488056_12317 [Cohaesibacter marisflavi]